MAVADATGCSRAQAGFLLSKGAGCRGGQVLAVQPEKVSITVSFWRIYKASLAIHRTFGYSNRLKAKHGAFSLCV